MVSNMVGAGVFVSAGFMAQEMTPGAILLAWVVGAVLALSGARAYAEAAFRVPRSGGEYRFLSDLLHPALGYLAGWASLLVGFSAPIAANAVSAGSFARTLLPGLDPQATGAAIVVVLTVLHALGLRTSKWTQNAIAAANAALLLGFVTMGLVLGRQAWPQWTPPSAPPGSPLLPFMSSLFFVAFAFSGWNAAVYGAEEFRDPKRDVPRAMLIGCSLVAVLYLLVNWVFVANLTPERAKVVFDYDASRVTLGHLITRDLLGEAGGSVMSVLAIVAFVSAMSAMTFAGPRIYAAMARDGFLPRALAGSEGAPPVGSILLQAALSIVLIYTHTVKEVLGNVGALLTLFSALVALSLFRLRPRAPLLALVAAAVYVASTVLMLWFGVQRASTVLHWVALVAVVAMIAYLVTRAGRRVPVET